MTGQDRRIRFAARALALVGLLLLVAAVSGCEGRAPAPARPAVQAPVTNATLVGDQAEGARLWKDKQCTACHGQTALGGIGGPLAATPLEFGQFLSQVRNAIPPKPAMSAADLSDAQAYSVYLWLHAPSTAASTAVPATPAPLPAGQELGIELWTSKGCDQCHGAFGQGSDKAPALAGQSYPFERQRAVMRQSADQNPRHAATNMPDDLLARLLDWLRKGADPTGGC
jgi:mono/diheme cytochrome c family protein